MSREREEIQSIQYVIQLARTKGPDAIRKLVALLNSADERIQLAAANAILDRGFGKPAQAVAVSASNFEQALLALLNGSATESGDAERAESTTH